MHNAHLMASLRQRGGAPGYSGKMRGKVFRVFRSSLLIKRSHDTP